MTRMAKFNIGEFVVHKRHGYRAVVVDVDPLFQASGRYNPQAIKRSFAKRHPWYRLLVADSNQITYVEEVWLSFDSSQEEIENPNMNDYIKKDKKGYSPASGKH